MLKIFLSSHGTLASGMKKSIEILAGQQDKLTVFDAYVNEDSLEQALDEFFDGVSAEEQVILLSDLYGGSVNQKLFLYLDHPNTWLVAGVNLAFVLELVLKDDIDSEELDRLIGDSRRMLRRVTWEEEVQEDEDFL